MDSFKLGSLAVGLSEPVFIIAEIGSNHDGSLGRAKEMIDAAIESGANAVKFQSFTAEGLFSPLRPIQGSTPENILGYEEHPAYKVIDELTLRQNWHAELKTYSDKAGIIFLSAPFEAGRAELLNSIGVPAFKIASGDITNLPLIKLIASFKLPIILSTGASFLAEVEAAVETIREEGNEEIALLHCVSLYPPDFSEVNLNAMAYMGAALELPYGISDHTPGPVVALGAVALGASIIEKHLTLDSTLEGPDHPYAMEVMDFKKMVDDVRIMEKSLGDGVKRPSPGEFGERIGARRSIYTTRDIDAGTVLTNNMLKTVRHAYGLEPAQIELLLGTKTNRGIRANTIITLEDIDEAAGGDIED